MYLLKKYDSWTIQRILRHVLYWGTWGLFYVVTNYYTKGIYPFWNWVAFELLVIPIKASTAYIIAYKWMPKYLFRNQPYRFLISSFFTVVLMGVLLYIMHYKVVYPFIMNWTSDFYFKEFIYKIIELVHISSLVIGIKFYANILEQQRVENELERMVQEAELKFLKNQIQPHFLFNTLNNLYGMVLSKEERAPDAILKLSDMLSYMLYESDQSLVSLKNEIENLDNYIALEKLRYERKLNLSYNKPSIDANLKIAPMLLIPFVENAFKHGPASEDFESFINIDIEVANNDLSFTITNSISNYDNQSALKSGIGLNNVIKRLQLIYPNRHDLQIIHDDDFTVILKLNLKESI